MSVAEGGAGYGSVLMKTILPLRVTNQSLCPASPSGLHHCYVCSSHDRFPDVCTGQSSDGVSGFVVPWQPLGVALGGLTAGLFLTAFIAPKGSESRAQIGGGNDLGQGLSNGHFSIPQRCCTTTPQHSHSWCWILCAGCPHWSSKQLLEARGFLNSTAFYAVGVATSGWHRLRIE